MGFFIRMQSSDETNACAYLYRSNEWFLAKRYEMKYATENTKQIVIFVTLLQLLFYYQKYWLIVIINSSHLLTETILQT
ncbi:hypothetical protein B1A85_00230 [Chroococcidiopsis sp. TS-821]|nr:hypothetical protein B1A85_00230 [Chroococcidiopsis sp. TS-821]